MSTTTPAAEGTDATVALAEVARLQQQIALKEQELAERDKALALRETEARKAELTARVDALCKPDTNNVVRVAPAQRDGMLAFVLTLSEPQAEAFLSIQAQNAGIKMGETGYGVSVEQGGKTVGAKAQIDAKVADYQQKNPQADYVAALSEVTRAEPDLYRAYQVEERQRAHNNSFNY